jgi:hypothetical protein
LGRLLRIILTGYFVWLLAIFMPGHIRGRMTMGPRDPAGMVPSAAVEESCCAAHSAPAVPTDKPTPRDRANCAVCFWAAGLLPVHLVQLDLGPSELLAARVAVVLEQYAGVEPLRESRGRDPPSRLLDA